MAKVFAFTRKDLMQQENRVKISEILPLLKKKCRFV